MLLSKWHVKRWALLGRFKDRYMNYSLIISEVSKIETYLSKHITVLIIIVVSLFFLSVLSSRKVNGILLVFYLCVILYMTLLNRNSRETRAVWLQLFKTYQHFLTDSYYRQEILNNIIFFIPLGTILAQLWPRWRISLVPVLLSVTIELIQFITKRGLLETDDVISNSIGGLIGFSTSMFWLYLKNNVKKIH